MRLDLDSVSVEIAGRSLIHDLDLSASPSEVVGLVGPNGSGKSTALKCVYRALVPDSGVVFLNGSDLRSLSLQDSARSVAALTQDNHATELDFTVREVVEMGRFPHQAAMERLNSRERVLCQEAMARMDVEHLSERSVLSLSGGERQRVLVARALVQEPDVLVLDEPTNHLDIRHQIELLSFLRRCGLTVVVALHDLNLAAATCDRIAVLRGGTLVRQGAPADVLEPELVREVFGVTTSVVTHPITGDPQLLYALDPRLEGTRR